MKNSWKYSAAVVAGLIAVSGGAVAASAQAQPAAVSHGAKPTIVLVYGAFEDGSAWNGVTARLQRAGYRVIVPAVPLRGVQSDVAYLNSLLKTVDGPLVLAGHSYGGMLITQIAAENPAVKALVYTAAFIPVAGESAGQLDNQFPGTLIGPDTLQTVSYPGGTDLYVKADAFHEAFAGDRSAADAAVAAATQRPADGAVFSDMVTEGAPTDIPKYAIVASQDRAIPPAAEQWEAKRAGATIVTLRSAHDVPTSHPVEVADLITRAARGH